MKPARVRSDQAQHTEAGWGLFFCFFFPQSMLVKVVNACLAFVRTARAEIVTQTSQKSHVHILVKRKPNGWIETWIRESRQQHRTISAESGYIETKIMRRIVFISTQYTNCAAPLKEDIRMSLSITAGPPISSNDTFVHECTCK